MFYLQNRKIYYFVFLYLLYAAGRRSFLKKLNKEIGSYCEKLAIKYLENIHYKVLETNYRNHIGEIDIICSTKNLLIIIEVKGRYIYNFGMPLEAVTLHKQQSIYKTASVYLQYHKLNNINVRFDVIEIYLNTDNDFLKLNHIEDAFIII